MSDDNEVKYEDLTAMEREALRALYRSDGDLDSEGLANALGVTIREADTIMSRLVALKHSPTPITTLWGWWGIYLRDKPLMMLGGLPSLKL